MGTLSTTAKAARCGPRLSTTCRSTTGRLLWPERRRLPSDQRYWPGKGAAKIVPDAWFPTKHADEAGKEQDSERPPTDAPRELAAAQRELDGGWIWRSTEESWLTFN